MTHQETVKIVRIMAASYPSFKPADIKDTIEAWELMLAEYPYEIVSVALKTIITTDLSDFAPTIGKVINEIHKLAEWGDKGHQTSLEAWDLVYQAISNSTYNAEREFEKLPPTIQKAVGSSGNLHSLAVDENFNLGVEQSHFIKAYERVLKEEEYERKIPNDVKALLKGMNSNGNDSIGNQANVLAIEEQNDGVVNPIST